MLKENIFENLESLREKESYHLDYDKELASYREERYGFESYLYGYDEMDGTAGHGGIEGARK